MINVSGQNETSRKIIDRESSLVVVVTVDVTVGVTIDVTLCVTVSVTSACTIFSLII